MLVHHNAAAAELWGRRPALGDPAERYCGAYGLHAPDGTSLTQERSPAAVALRERRPVRGVEAIAMTSTASAWFSARARASPTS
jgi:hypothetical protein